MTVTNTWTQQEERAEPLVTMRWMNMRKGVYHASAGGAC